jgi:uncharacterized membrane protein YsdA (DUF1294 family)
MKFTGKLLTFLVIYLAAAWNWNVPHAVAAGYLVLSAITFIAYAVDKATAVSGRWRTKESSLLLLGLLGGWPGGMLAQQVFRHKTSKVSFRSLFRTTVALNVCAFAILSSPPIDAWRYLS